MDRKWNDNEKRREEKRGKQHSMNRVFIQNKGLASEAVRSLFALENVYWVL